MSHMYVVTKPIYCYYIIYTLFIFAILFNYFFTDIVLKITMAQLSKIDKIIITITTDLSSSSVNTSSSSNNSISDIMNSTNESNASFSSEEAGDDILFPLYQLLMHGRRRSKVQDFLDTVHLYSDTVFKEHFRLQRRTAYL